jgi:hypothetical protein
VTTNVRLGAAAFLLLCLASAAIAAPGEIERVDAAEVGLGQSVTLQLRLRGSLMASEPDLTPLEAAFHVLDVARSQRRSVVKGAYDASADWQITLLPKHAGTLEIPALAVGSVRSEPQSVRVRTASQGGSPSQGAPAAAPPASRAPPVFLRSAAERPDPYEQERLLLRIRLYAGPEFIEGALGEPAIEGASVERLGEDRPFREEVSGRSYRGLERSYAIVPEAPGQLVVPPVVLEGRVRDVAGRRRPGFFGRSLMDDFFSGGGFGEDLFASLLDRGTRRVVVESEPLVLDVRPRPEASGNEWWLPARDVSLREQWEPDPAEVHVGEALTRQITLRVEGAGASQLPTLATPEPEGVKLYAETPETSETETGSVRVQAITVIPTQPGRLELPPIEVAWWDTKSDTQQLATLGARTLEVLPAVAGGTSPNEPGPLPARAASGATSVPQPASAVLSDSARKPLAGWWAGALLAAGVAAAAGYRWGRRKGASHGTRRGNERALRRACRRSDPAAAERALRRLLQAWDPGRTPIDAEARARAAGDDAFAREVAKLQSVRYSTSGEDWQGQRLWKAYRSIRKPRKEPGRRPRGGLPPLYPAAAGSRGSAPEAG